MRYPRNTGLHDSASRIELWDELDHSAEEIAQVLRNQYLDHTFLRSVTRFDPAR